MNRHNVENYKMLTRVAAFADNNVGLFPKSSPAVEIRKSLAAVVQELGELSTARSSADSALRSSRNAKTADRDTLKGLLAQADLTARAIGSDKFRTPRNRSDHSLVVSGRAFATDIEPLKKEFIGYGLSPEQVTAAATALEHSALVNSAGKAKRSAAIRAFEEKMDAAMGYVRQLDALVVNTFADGSAPKAEWTMARTVGKVPARKRVVDPPKAA